MVSLLISAVLPMLAEGLGETTGAASFQVVDVSVSAVGGGKNANPEDFVLSRVSIREGAFVSQADIARDQRDLLQSGVFSEVRVLVANADEEGSVRITYQVVIAPRFAEPLIVEGAKKFSIRKIRKTLDLESGERIDQARLDEKCAVLRKKYREAYYFNAQVSSRLTEPDADGFAQVVLLINEGARAKIDTFEFVGNHAFTDSALRKSLGEPSWYNPFAVFMSSWRKMALDFEYVRDTLAALYRDAGYLDVEVEAPDLDYSASSDKPVMRVYISEGTRYDIASLSVRGVSIFPQNELDRLAEHLLPIGAAASQRAISAAEKEIKNYYGSRGYVDTVVRTTLTPDPSEDSKTVARPLNVTFEIDEGALATIRGVTIRGNSVTKDKVVRRELTVAPGMTFDTVAAENSRRRVENLGFFESVRLHDEPSKDDPSQRDLIYSVTEGSFGNLLVGVATSSMMDDFFCYLDISQNNFDISNWPTFRGAGQRMRLSASLGESTSEVDLSWTDPWFLDRRQSLMTELYRRETGYSEFDETRIGAGVSLAVPLRYGRASLRIGIEQVETDDVIPGTFTLYDAPETTYSFVEAVEESYLRLPVRFTWLYDSRNHAFIPSRGMRNSIFAEIQSSAWGSEFDSYKLGFDLRQYIPLWFDHVLSLRLRGEAIDTFGDTDSLPPNELLFLGGAYTVRGFRTRQIGPKALPVDGNDSRARPIGGQTLGMFSAEYTIPLVSFIRLASFFDVGNVWAEPFDADFDELASCYGFGLRLDVPGFPIRLDYAFPLDSDDEYSRKRRFVFSIGFN